MFFRLMLRTFTRFFFFLRYRFEVKGLKEIQTLKDKGGVIFLPNHPSELDPVILYCILDGKVPLIPLVAEDVLQVPIIGSILKKIGVLPIPNVDHGGNEYVKLRAKKALESSVAVVRQNKNLLVYPAGGLKSSGLEDLGGVSGVNTIVQQSGNSPVVLVRTTGLWGSSFSKALTHASPDIGKQILHALKIILLNGFFFLPRRKVLIEMVLAPSDFPRSASKQEFNRYLEAWYNARGGEPLTLVPEQFWSSELPVIKEKNKSHTYKLSDIPFEVQNKVIQEIITLTKRNDIKPEDNLARDLAMDSLDVVQLIAFLDEEFGVKGVQPKDLETVLDAMVFAVNTEHVERKEEDSSCSWQKEMNGRPAICFETGKTIQEVFLRKTASLGNLDAYADSNGIITYSKMRMRVLLLAKLIKKMPGNHIGILLPATGLSMLLVFATLFAKKVPVMLNWTVGSKALKDITAASSLEVVLTSQKFLTQAKVMDIEAIAPLLVMLEDVGKQITLFDKIKALIDSKKSVEKLLQLFELENVQESDIAALLFTSGTESTPKGVPLTHRNILSNQRAALSCAPFKTGDVLYSFLPPFHSFGFSITGLLPLLCGLKVVFSPDPTDGVMLARNVKRWGITVLCGAPTFLRTILRSAKPGELKSVRLVVSGAEKAPKMLLDEIKALGEIQFIEGYGITECAPILTLQYVRDVPKGVGKAIPGVEIKIVDLKTHEIYPSGKEGLIIASGPNIFSGYLQKNLASPFLELNGKTWYVTGDLGHLDEEGNLVLSGRLKRFVKMGGEMINLLGLEEALLKKWPSQEEETSFAICAKEREGERPELILFTTKDLSVQEVNDCLKEEGISSLAKVSKVQKIETMPILGTGKTNYRALELNIL